MKLTKEQFVKYVNLLEEMTLKENAIIKSLSCNLEWEPGNWISHFYDLLTEMCEFNLEEYEYGTDLDYYIWELNFGYNWKPGMVIENGQDIDLSNAEKLYDYITRESVG